MQRLLLPAALASALALAACGGDRPAADTDSAPATSGAATASDHQFSPEISEADFREMVRTLASDEFEGRAPGSPGGEKTVEYISAQFERIGLQPACDRGLRTRPQCVQARLQRRQPAFGAGGT